MKFILSIRAPTMSAGVIAAKTNWKKINVDMAMFGYCWAAGTLAWDAMTLLVSAGIGVPSMLKPPILMDAGPKANM